jgi:hypothetical protein
MHYFALLLSPENTGTPDPGEMAAYQEFHVAAARFIRAGDALVPSSTAGRITGGPEKPSVTDGPFAEGAEVAGGYYVFEADNLDEALGLAEQIPAAKYGAVEVWPMVHYTAPTAPVGNAWLALLLESPENVNVPDSPEWVARVAEHVEFGKAVGDHILAGAPLHPPSAATTVRVRDGKTTFTDGPYVEGAEVANGFYVLSATDRDEAVKLASMIPAGGVEVRQLAGVSRL